MPWRSVVNDLLVMLFVATMAVAVVYADRNMPDPPRLAAPPPKFIVVNTLPKHEPKLATPGTK